MSIMLLLPSSLHGRILINMKLHTHVDIWHYLCSAQPSANLGMAHNTRCMLQSCLSTGKPLRCGASLLVQRPLYIARTVAGGMHGGVCIYISAQEEQLCCCAEPDP